MLACAVVSFACGRISDPSHDNASSLFAESRQFTQVAGLTGLARAPIQEARLAPEREGNAW